MALTRHAACASGVAERHGAARHPHQRAASVGRILAVSAAAGVDALGYAVGPQKGAAARWFDRLRVAAEAARLAFNTIAPSLKLLYPGRRGLLRSYFLREEKETVQAAE